MIVAALVENLGKVMREFLCMAFLRFMMGTHGMTCPKTIRDAAGLIRFNISRLETAFRVRNIPQVLQGPLAWSFTFKQPCLGSICY